MSQIPYDSFRQYLPVFLNESQTMTWCFLRAGIPLSSLSIFSTVSSCATLFSCSNHFSFAWWSRFFGHNKARFFHGSSYHRPCLSELPAFRPVIIPGITVRISVVSTFPVVHRVKKHQNRSNVEIARRLSNCSGPLILCSTKKGQISMSVSHTQECTRKKYMLQISPVQKLRSN